MYRVGTPDQLEVSILPEPVIERALVVRPDGRISVDLIGDVEAAGKTVEEIAQDIQERIARYKRDPRVTVRVAAAQSTEVTVLGEVGRPQTLTLARETRVVEGIGFSGGPSRFASKKNLRIIRFEGSQTRIIPVDLAAIEKGDLRTNVLLAGGDILVVPPNWSARVGYAINVIFFPIQQILGLGGGVARAATF
jgi:polysaccharide export outer membrane protein